MDNSVVFCHVSLQQSSKNFLFDVPMLLDVSHEIDFVYYELAVILLHVGVILENVLRNSKLQPNTRKPVVHKIAEFRIDPRCTGNCKAESVTQVKENNPN